MTKVPSHYRRLVGQLHPDLAEVDMEDEVMDKADRKKVEMVDLRRMGWPLNEADILSLIQGSMTSYAGQKVSFTPFFFSNLYQSPHVVADFIQVLLEKDVQASRIRQFINSTILAERDIQGARIQLKGRISKKSEEAEKVVWEYGNISIMTFDDVVDYAEAAALTRSGYIGIKVWIIYKRRTQKKTVTVHNKSLDALVKVPRPTKFNVGNVGWWNIPGPFQPAANRTWECCTESDRMREIRQGEPSG